MSLRLIAKDLYRLQQTVDRLEKELSTAPPEKRVPVERKLVQARIERDRVRQMLDGHLDR